MVNSDRISLQLKTSRFQGNFDDIFEFHESKNQTLFEIKVIKEKVLFKILTKAHQFTIFKKYQQF